MLCYMYYMYLYLYMYLFFRDIFIGLRGLLKGLLLFGFLGIGKILIGEFYDMRF